MTDDEILRAPQTDKIAPDSLDLHAKPRPVTRLNRKALIGLSGTGLALIFTATFFALQPPTTSNPVGGDQELYNTRSKETPAQLSELPYSYTGYAPPVLGAPLPGELGSAVLETERLAGLDPLPPKQTALPFQTDHLTDTQRAERIRLAQRAQQSLESSVTFTLSQGAAASAFGGGSVGGNASLTDVATALSGGESSQPASLLSEEDPNHQGRKLGFLQGGPDTSIYNPFPLETPASPYQLMAGTVIAASLITGLNSDLPGQIIAQVTQPVYDTVTGRHLLIPQGSRLIGTYDSVVAFGQSRALVVWQRLIMPDGSSIVIDNLPATDRAGYAGLEDEVDFHTWRIIKGIALSTMFAIGSELAFDSEGDLVEALRRGTQNPINRAGDRLVERNINVQPTITIRPGYPLRIIVNKDIVLRPYNDGGAL